MYGEVLCEDEYKTTIDCTRTSYNTVAEELLLLHTEVMAAMLLKHVVLLERTFVEQHIDALTGCVLTTIVLFLNSFLTSTETGLFALLDELLDFF